MPTPAQLVTLGFRRGAGDDDSRFTFWTRDSDLMHLLLDSETDRVYHPISLSSEEHILWTMELASLLKEIGTDFLQLATPEQRRKFRARMNAFPQPQRVRSPGS